MAHGLDVTPLSLILLEDPVPPFPTSSPNSMGPGSGRAVHTVACNTCLPSALSIVLAPGSEEGEQLITAAQALPLLRGSCLPVGLIFKDFTANNTSIKPIAGVGSACPSSVEASQPATHTVWIPKLCGSVLSYF